MTKTLSDGSPVPADNSHTELKSNHQQKNYIVLSKEDRVDNHIRPVRLTYIHERCGTTTQMSRSIAETYATEPTFYTGTFCVHCSNHFPVGPEGEFIWEDGTKVGS